MKMARSRAILPARLHRELRLVALRRDFSSFMPHGEERGQRPRVSNHGRTGSAAPDLTSAAA
jgi:hypothetical protein